MGAAVVCRPHAAKGVAVTPAARWADERGAAALEAALVSPLVVVLLVVLLQAGLLGADVVAAQGVSREAARVAAVADDSAVREAAQRAAGARRIRVAVDPPSARRSPGDLVTATVKLRSRAFAGFGHEIWVPARTTMRVEAP